MAQLPFGGTHTVEKLAVLQNYLGAYQRVLGKTTFLTIFFDAFAGTGQIPVDDPGTLFEDVEEAQPFIEGSARRALSITPPFGRYVFVEKSRQKAALLDRLKVEFPLLAGRIEVEHKDANLAVGEFCCTTNWRKNRAVMFLDPFGNQVDWSTLEKIAATRAIDLWYLFPAHLGVNRQISANGQFDDSKAASLDRLLGTTEWRSRFIQTSASTDLWGQARETRTKQASVDSITRYMINRMKEIFHGVVLDQWLPLGRGGSHWYSLLFACSNPSAKAKEIAERVAIAVMKRK